MYGRSNVDTSRRVIEEILFDTCCIVFFQKQK